MSFLPFSSGSPFTLFPLSPCPPPPSSSLPQGGEGGEGGREAPPTNDITGGIFCPVSRSPPSPDFSFFSSPLFEGRDENFVAQKFRNYKEKKIKNSGVNVSARDPLGTLSAKEFEGDSKSEIGNDSQNTVNENESEGSGVRRENLFVGTEKEKRRGWDDTSEDERESTSDFNLTGVNFLPETQVRASNFIEAKTEDIPCDLFSGTDRNFFPSTEINLALDQDRGGPPRPSLPLPPHFPPPSPSSITFSIMRFQTAPFQSKSHCCSADELGEETAAFEREYAEDHSWEDLQEDEQGRLRPLVCASLALHARPGLSTAFPYLLLYFNIYTLYNYSLLLLSRSGPSTLIATQEMHCSAWHTWGIYSQINQMYGFSSGLCHKVNVETLQTSFVPWHTCALRADLIACQATA